MTEESLCVSSSVALIMNSSALAISVCLLRVPTLSVETVIMFNKYIVCFHGACEPE